MADRRGKVIALRWALLSGLAALVVGTAGGYFYASHKIVADLIAYYTPPPRDPDAPPVREARAYGLPLNNPAVVPAKKADHMRDDDPVYGVVFNGVARAYPRWILIGYHVVNDTVRGEALLVVQCEVCSSAAAWEPYAAWPVDEPLAFQACGFHGGTFEMCDNYTNSRWQPFSGKSFFGHLKGYQLKKRVPVVIQRWKRWREEHPDTEVVYATDEVRRREHSHGPQFDIGQPAIPDYMARTANMQDTRMAPHALVFGIHDPASRTSLVVPIDQRFSGPEPKILQLGERRFFYLQFDEFAAVAFYLLPRFAGLRVASTKPLTLADDRGGLWNALGAPLKGSRVSEKLIPADAYFAEWFEWISEHPQTTVYEAR